MWENFEWDQLLWTACQEFCSPCWTEAFYGKWVEAYDSKTVCSVTFCGYVYGTEIWSEIVFLMNPAGTQTNFGVLLIPQVWRHLQVTAFYWHCPKETLEEPQNYPKIFPVMSPETIQKYFPLWTPKLSKNLSCCEPQNYPEIFPVMNPKTIQKSFLLLDSQVQCFRH